MTFTSFYGLRNGHAQAGGESPRGGANPHLCREPGTIDEVEIIAGLCQHGFEKHRFPFALSDSRARRAPLRGAHLFTLHRAHLSSATCIAESAVSGYIQRLLQLLNYMLCRQKAATTTFLYPNYQFCDQECKCTSTDVITILSHSIFFVNYIFD